jgi:hypothetical protein
LYLMPASAAIRAGIGPVHRRSFWSRAPATTAPEPRSIMPVRTDYLLRIIQQLAQVFARALGLRRAGRHDEALALLDESALNTFGLTMRVALALSTQDLVALLTDKHGSTLRSASLLAELLMHEGDTRAEQGAAERGRQAHRRALALVLAAADLPDNTASDLEPASVVADNLRRRLGAASIAVEDLSRAARLHERAGSFASAENARFVTLSRADEAPQAIPEARAFYERLLALSDDELERGGLPRDEVEEGLRALAAKERDR